MLFNRDWKTVCSRRFFRWRACAARLKTRGFSGFCAGKIVLQLEVCAWDFHRLNSVEVSISRVWRCFAESYPQVPGLQALKGGLSGATLFT